MFTLTRKPNQKAWIVGVILTSAAQCLDSFHPLQNATSAPHLVRRFLTPGSTNPTATGLNAYGQPTHDPCAPVNLTAQTWVDLGIDEYIANYPNADKLTIQEFAAELYLPNFFCGIGMECLAGQLCHPAAGVNWIVLYAIQEWNAYMNSFYTAIEDSISLIRDASADIASDFIPHARPTEGLYGWSIATIVVGTLASFTALIVPAVMPKDAMQMVVEAAKIGPGSGLLGGLAIPSAGRSADTESMLKELEAARAGAEGEQPADVWSDAIPHERGVIRDFLTQLRATHGPDSQPPTTGVHPSAPPSSHGSDPSIPHLRKRALTSDERPKLRHPSPYAFTRWSHLATHLTVLQNELQGFISATVKVATMQPLLADGGIASVLQQGAFLYKNPTQVYLNENLKALAQITALSEFFKSVNMFVTIGSDDCKFGGPNGAKNGEEDLSFCTKDGLMMNIIRAEFNKAINKIPNAGLLKTKYGYSVEYLANLAWDCQKKYGVQKPGEVNFPPPVSMKSDCIFAIPVCDCTLPAVAHLRKKKKGTIKACRKGAGLPI